MEDYGPLNNIDYGGLTVSRPIAYIPMRIQCAPDKLADMFEGGAPKVGDYIGANWVCYKVTEADGLVSVDCRYRVIRN